MKGKFEKNNLRIFARKICGFRSFPPMFHSHTELVYVLSGELRLTVDGRDIQLEQGQIGIVFPYAVHSYERAPDAEVIILMFAPEVVHEYEKVLKGNKPVVSFCTDDGTLLAMFERIVQVYATPDIAHEKIAASYLSGVVGELLLGIELTAERDGGDVILRVLGYCATHFADENISIRSVAQALFISPSYVTKLFSQKLGYGFREYINMLRLAEAKHYLKHTDLKITEIMGLCGFKNQSSFNRVFVAEFGRTPREYRAKN